ncbi:sugar kinase [Phenylobacterium sp.]|uniref:sugar kinase n=1 Tax=Phenylobacterium sp. TaxID=1871053 RepID=UPI0027199A77|nr:sugar kinase [Phenylobacterium sp.]MDO8381189.1 sugar kinase [Phenylobacterium sp.]
MAGQVVCFGEVLVRLAAPENELLLQSPSLKVCFGGAEANVAVSLARFGHAARMLSVLPDNGLGQAAIDELRRHGVDTSGISLTPGRMGLYFLTPGAGQRTAQVLYDRADSAFCRGAGAIDWEAGLRGADWLHVSGVTAAIGPDTAGAAVDAVRAARRLGLTVSMDCNYRATLWQAWNGDAPAILAQMLSQADLVFGDHRDIALVLRTAAPEGLEAEGLRRWAAERAFKAWPNLARLACTDRVQHTVNHHDLTGFLFSRQGAWRTESRPLNPIVDRIGGGDAFAAGVIHGLLAGLSEADTLDFAVAATALKHTIPGDFNLATLADVEALLSANGLDVRR